MAERNGLVRRSVSAQIKSCTRNSTLHAAAHSPPKIAAAASSAQHAVRVDGKADPRRPAEGEARAVRQVLRCAQQPFLRAGLAGQQLQSAAEFRLSGQLRHRLLAACDLLRRVIGVQQIRRKPRAAEGGARRVQELEERFRAHDVEIARIFMLRPGQLLARIAEGTPPPREAVPVLFRQLGHGAGKAHPHVQPVLHDTRGREQHGLRRRQRTAPRGGTRAADGNRPSERM